MSYIPTPTRARRRLPARTAAVVPKPSNYLPWAIATTLLCCLPAGIVSIVFAAQVDGKWNSGDYAGAQASSKKARTWAIVSAVVGLALSAIYIVALVAASD